ncbi:MAG: cytochrome c [Nitrospiraceae bacterium]
MSSWGAAQDFRGNPDKGQAIYGKHDLHCHGKLGDGNGPDTKDLIVQLKDFHTPKSRGKSDFEFLIVISKGVLFSPMHSWRRQLTEEDMVDVVNYIRALAPFSAIS